MWLREFPSTLTIKPCILKEWIKAHKLADYNIISLHHLGFRLVFMLRHRAKKNCRKSTENTKELRLRIDFLILEYSQEFFVLRKIHDEEDTKNVLFHFHAISASSRVVLDRRINLESPHRLPNKSCAARNVGKESHTWC